MGTDKRLTSPCPRRLPITFGRETEYWCTDDDAPCDASREGYCREWPDDERKEETKDAEEAAFQR